MDALNNGLMKVNFGKIEKALNGLWKALAPFAVKVGEGLLWLWENVLVPFGTWTANEVVPRYLETISIVVGALNKVIEKYSLFFSGSGRMCLIRWQNGPAACSRRPGMA